MAGMTPQSLPDADRWLRKPRAGCDVVLKGGITSGVIYPRALVELGRNYRFHGMGGSSAGAIGAALGAAAEFGRSKGGFAELYKLPDQLNLRRMFRPERSTRALLPILMAATGFTSKGVQRTGWARALVLIATIVLAFPIAALVGLAIGALPAILSIVFGAALGVPLIVASVLLALIGATVAIAVRLSAKLTRAVPANLFGICRGLDKNGRDEGLTNWLSAKIDLLAGLEPDDGPLRFGQLWTGRRRHLPHTIADIPARERRVDLRMITTCLSRQRPYEMPLKARNFLYDPVEWALLFPPNVMAALDAASPVDDAAAAHTPPLHRMPEPADLPVIVATRMSLSFPLLISAVPLWSTTYRKSAPDEPAPPDADDPAQYEKLWFTDGGLASNFPVHLFDAPLPSRPTFAINLGQFSGDRRRPFDDQRSNLVLARDNSSFLPPYQAIPESGFGAILGFASASFATARDWHDNSLLETPGYRDRIVRVLQTKSEGGLNLSMSPEVIAQLAERGQIAAAELSGQFRDKNYPASAETKTHTGWDNHRWVRYRALLAGMPTFLASYLRGLDALDLSPDDLPSYEFDGEGAALAELISRGLADTAHAVEPVNEKTVANLADAPGPATVIRRVPQL